LACGFGLVLAGSVAPALTSAAAEAATSNWLWQVGAADGKNEEFALAPNRYGEFKADGLFAVGRSEAKQDWPYAHPGPLDGWAGGRPHTFSVVFGLKSVPSAGECTLRVDILDTQGQAPPELAVSLNGEKRSVRLPAGAGDFTIFGEPARGKRHSFEVKFPATALRAGPNSLGLTTLSGSWFLYDSVRFAAPPGAELHEVTGTFVQSVNSPPVLVERGGQLRQVVQIGLHHFGAPAEATVRVGDSTAQRVSLSKPTEQLEIAVSAVERETTSPLSIEISGKAVATATVALQPVRKWTVYLLPHSHVDIGYTHVQTEVEQAQWRYLETGIDLARKSAGNPVGSRFKWNVEVLWAVDSYLKQASPKKRQEFFEAVKAGQVGLDALYGNELTGLCREEGLLRLLTRAAKLAREAGVPIQSAMITDVPGYTWGIVPAFAHTGVKYFSIGPNGGDRIGHTIQAWGDKPFWWVGPNGKDKVLVWMTGTGYYQVFRSPASLQQYLAGLEKKGYPYDMVHVRHCLGDNGAPDPNFADTVRKWNDSHAYPKLVIATTGEMFRDFEKRYGDKLPVAKGDFTPYWEDGAASSARETAMNRASADRLLQAETLFAMAGPQAFPAERFTAAWRNVVLYDEHTWGAHNSISQPDAPFVKSQWAIKQAFALEANTQSRQLLQEALGLCGASGGAVRSFDVLNTASSARTDLVLLPKSWGLDGDEVLDSKGSVLPAQKLASGELAFLARDVPGFGAKRYTVRAAQGRTQRSQLKAEAGSLSTGTISLRVDPKSGALASLVYQGSELVDSAGQTAVNDFFYLPGTDLKGLQRNGPVKVTVKEAGPVLASLLVECEAPGCAKLTREIRLINGLDRVDLLNTIDKKPVRAKEGVHFGFGFKLPDSQMHLDVPWGVIRPEADQLPGACKNWLTVQRWIALSNAKMALTLSTPDAPLVEIGAITANLVGSLSDPRAWMDKLEPSSTLYSWVMNNHWHTNYRAEQDGDTLFRYSIWLSRKFSPAESTLMAASWNQPLLPVPATGATPLEPPLRVDSDGVWVTALKPSDDGKALIARVLAGEKRQRPKLTWREPKPAQVWLSDTSETPLSDLRGQLELDAWGMATLRAEIR
jgi:hypothetical protein